MPSAQELGRELDFGGEPRGHGAGGEGLGLDGGGVAVEAVLEVNGAGDARLEGGALVVPAEPAVERIHGAHDGALFGGGDAGVGAEFFAQGGIGRELGRDEGEDAGGAVERGGVGGHGREERLKG